MSILNEVFEQIDNLDKIIDDNKIVWFYAKQLCEYLDFKKELSTILKYHVDDENKKKYNKILTHQKMVGEKYNHRHVFVNEYGLHQLLLASTKPKAKQYVKIMGNVMKEIREKGKFIHTEHKGKTYKDETGKACFTNNSVISDKDSLFYKEDSSEYELIERLSEDINPVLFQNTPVMYMYATSIKNLHDKRIILKIGYSAKLYKREETHKGISGFNCDLKLIGVRHVNCEQDERDFHDYMNKNYDDLVYKLSIDGTNKRECYYLDYACKIIEMFNEWNINLKKNNPQSNSVSQLEYDNNKVLLSIQESKEREQGLKVRELELKIEYHKLVNGIQ